MIDIDIGRAGFGAITVTGGVGIWMGDDGGVPWRVDGNRLETVDTVELDDGNGDGNGDWRWEVGAV